LSACGEVYHFVVSFFEEHGLGWWVKY
jgi:hypothetical protein